MLFLRRCKSFFHHINSPGAGEVPPCGSSVFTFGVTTVQRHRMLLYVTSE